MQKHPPSDRHMFFARTWNALAADGHCDDLGGAEHRRVYWDWVKAGCPRDLESFIREQANKPPEATSHA